MNDLDVLYHAHKLPELPLNKEANSDFGHLLMEVNWMAETMSKLLKHPMPSEYNIGEVCWKLLQCVGFYCNPTELEQAVRGMHSMNAAVPNYLRSAIVTAVIKWTDRYDSAEEL